MNNQLELLINGRNTDYEPVLNSLRSFLNSIDIIRISTGGAIIFLTGKEAGKENLQIKVFPLKLNVFLLDHPEESFINPFVEKIFEKICRSQSYENTWHFEHFRNHHLSNKHFTYKVPDEKILAYNQKTVTVANEELSWKAFYDKIEAGSIDPDTYEQLLFISGADEITFVPLPVLSTPFILVVLNSNDVKDHWGSTLRSMYFRSRDSISKYLYSRLIDKLTRFLEKSGESITEEALVNQFIQELCEIILPISYKLNDQPEIDYYTKWPPVTPPSQYNLSLLNGKYRIIFKLTSFAFTDFEHSQGNRQTPFHESQLYHATIDQSAQLLGKVFTLMHSNWKHIQLAEENALKKITLALSHIDIEYIVSKVKFIEQEFLQLRHKGKKQYGDGPINQLRADKKGVSLIINRVVLITPNKNITSSRLRGFRYLHYIIEKAAASDYTYSIDTNDLFYNVGIDREESSKNRNAQKQEIQKAANELVERMLLFIDKHQSAIEICVNADSPYNEQKFESQFFHYARCHSEMVLAKVYRYATNKRAEKANHLMTRLSEIYEKYDLDRFDAEKGKFTTKDIFRPFNKAAGLFKSNSPESVIRDHFRAMLIFLRVKLYGELQENEKADLDFFLKNLEEAGLVNPGEQEPAHRKKYTYHQRGIDHFINWE